ncbi:DUF2637 domain-containing protein [Streptomyces griseorubiginosus]|uniref:DUF2637 domain-containing protein n=1 Tax=Streptomyces griseorubiginosus TaxID=67304 RepID=UPI0036274335
MRREFWLRRGCALVVAAVAAYASYVHQRAFALQGGADAVSATLWPFSVDGLLLLATVGLLTPVRSERRRARAVIWLAFLLGIAVSLAANVAAAPSLTWKPMLVAGWPPVALLLSVELLAHGPVSLDHGRYHDALAVRKSETQLGHSQEPGENESETEPRPVAKGNREDYGLSLRETDDSDAALGDGLGPRGIQEASPHSDHSRMSGRTAEDVMWAYYQRQLAIGRVPSGAELDRVAGTNNYGRAVLKRWRRSGRILAGVGQPRLPITPDRT